MVEISTKALTRPVVSALQKKGHYMLFLEGKAENKIYSIFPMLCQQTERQEVYETCSDTDHPPCSYCWDKTPPLEPLEWYGHVSGFGAEPCPCLPWPQIRVSLFMDTDDKGNMLF